MPRAITTGLNEFDYLLHKTKHSNSVYAQLVNAERCAYAQRSPTERRHNLNKSQGQCLWLSWKSGHFQHRHPQFKSRPRQNFI